MIPIHILGGLKSIPHSSRTSVYTFIMEVTPPPPPPCFSVGTKRFDHVTLTFDLHLKKKNFNIGQNYFTVRDSALIFVMCVPCYKTFPLVPTFFIMTLTVTFDLYLKNFNIVHNYSTVGDGAFIFTWGRYICISSDKTFPFIHKFLTLAP